MKIGILSMQRVFNYGSFLQAYGLKSLLEDMGHEVFFLDIEYCNNKAKTVDHVKSNLTSKEARKKLISKIDRYLWKRLKYRSLNKALDEMFIEVQSSYLDLPNEPVYHIKCDAVVIGSDEVFNCMQKSELSYQLFGQGLPAPYIITYAASCGYTNIDDININIRKNIKNALSNVKMFSVRDTNTFNFVRSLTGKRPLYHLDPVLMFDFTQELKKAMEEVKIYDKFMVIYAYRNRINSREEIAAIRKYAKENHLKTIAIGGSQPWCDEFIILTPFQVLAYFMKAACIVTDTFHGTVLAAKYNKSFATIIRESNRNKLGDLLKRLHLENHMLKDMKNIGKVLKAGNYDYFNNIIAAERLRTMEYLQQINREELILNE